MKIPRFLRILQERWDEAQTISNARKLLDLGAEMEIEKSRYDLTTAKTKVILAEAEYQESKAAIIMAKIQQGGNHNGYVAGSERSKRNAKAR